MIPGMNPRQMKQAMKRMGIQQEDLDAKEVIIRLEDKEIVISNPNVSKVNMMGQDTYQIVGEESIRELDATPDINEDDIQTVVEQTGASEEDAKAAIEECKGDLAEAIMKLKKD
ncbi:MAG: nascent polypeptide-associated complex protein [Nanoarchaeota archaeon]|nr:nascent polypeptide-associated complex protein [Nanoarchaeota archaeon]MBU1321789.1 nascent polypeptide-associated complex protein [Nanoarchaeota archaeon]MBU1598195.1 nascent polypeptide-associated complex protein [Nanoarchaeota archaeon]MBU2441664.1 nascent polypeptide-associated complex protein [Nanoarchaeota archaeon]